MRNAIVSILAAALLAGCATTEIDKEKVCAAATAAYTVYLAIINANGTPTEDQVMAANAAALVLSTQCGWTSPEAPDATVKRSAGRWNFVDTLGVPVLLPPN